MNQNTVGINPFKQTTDGDKALQPNHRWGKAQKRYTADGVKPIFKPTDGVKPIFKPIFKPTDGVKPIFKPTDGVMPNNHNTEEVKTP